jgi:hypothetical protein
LRTLADEIPTPPGRLFYPERTAPHARVNGVRRMGVAGKAGGFGRFRGRERLMSFRTLDVLHGKQNVR